MACLPFLRTGNTTAETRAAPAAARIAGDLARWRRHVSLQGAEGGRGEGRGAIRAGHRADEGRQRRVERDGSERPAGRSRVSLCGGRAERHRPAKLRAQAAALAGIEHPARARHTARSVGLAGHPARRRPRSQLSFEGTRQAAPHPHLHAAGRRPRPAACPLPRPRLQRQRGDLERPRQSAVDHGQPHRHEESRAHARRHARCPRHPAGRRRLRRLRRREH